MAAVTDGPPGTSETCTWTDPSLRDGERKTERLMHGAPHPFVFHNQRGMTMQTHTLALNVTSPVPSFKLEMH